MRVRTLLAAAVAAAALATPATAADDATAIEIAEHGAVTGVTTSVVPPTASLGVAAYPTVLQAIAKGVPSAYGTVTAAYSCSVAVSGDVAFVTITECSVTSNTLDTDNNPASGYINAGTTAGLVNLTGRTIRVCVRARVTPRAAVASFDTVRSCGISI
jgi:hypothetical protein